MPSAFPEPQTRVTQFASPEFRRDVVYPPFAAELPPLQLQRTREEERRRPAASCHLLQNILRRAIITVLFSFSVYKDVSGLVFVLIMYYYAPTVHLCKRNYLPWKNLHWQEWFLGAAGKAS